MVKQTEGGVSGGTPAGTRTRARGLGNHCSIHLSYRGTGMRRSGQEEEANFVVEIGGLEPPTSAMRTPRSPC